MAVTGFATLTGARASLSSAVSGDLLLGFEAAGGTGANQNLVIDLGSAATFGSININAGVDLANVYGTNWYSRTDLSWGIFSANAGKTLWASVDTTGDASFLVSGSSSAQATPRQDFLGLVTQFNTDIVNGQGLTVGVNEAISESGSWTAYSPSETPFDAFSSSIEAPTTDSLDLYSLPPAGGGVSLGAPGVYVGTLTLGLNGTGNISAVPEPSTYVLFGLGALLLVIAYRRRIKA